MFALSDFLVSLWRRWQNAIHGINEVVATVLMTLTYVFAVTPVSLIFKLVDSIQLTEALVIPRQPLTGKPSKEMRMRMIFVEFRGNINHFRK